MLVLAATVASTNAWSAGSAQEREKEGQTRLTRELAEARRLGRPAWVATTPLEVTLTADYREMRRSVDSRLGLGKGREAIRILYGLIDRGAGQPQTWASYYLAQALLQVHEYPYAILEYQKHGATPIAVDALARCYLAYDQYSSALSYFQKALDYAKTSPQKNLYSAKTLAGIGDVYRKMGDFKQATAHYEKARLAYEAGTRESGRPSWYISQQKQNMQLMQEMKDVSDAAVSLDVTKLKPGAYTGKARGYAGDITVTVTIADGKITEARVTAQTESIPLSALEDVPAAVVAAQSPSVDAVTGATVTSHGIMAALNKALVQAR